MKIYKFRELTDETKRQRFLQILLKNTIWCAKPDDLNDQDEFRFRLDYTPSEKSARLLAEFISQYRVTKFLPPELSAAMVLTTGKLQEITAPHIAEIIQQCRTTIGVTSFSLVKSDNHLWEEYGGLGNGAYVEIDIPDALIDVSYHRVHYVQERVFHIDSFLESALLFEKKINNFGDILLTKTKKWSQEEEIRFIGKRQDVNFIVDGTITEIGFGPHVPNDTYERIMAETAGYCSVKNIRIVRL